MVNAEEEANDFTKISSALSINVGTALTPHWIRAMIFSADAANEHGKPWCLDPVGVGATPHRTKTCVELMEKKPTVVRGNASEIMALTAACKVEVPEGLKAGGGKGVDSTAGSDEAIPAAIALARAYGSVVAVSGAVDVITDGKKKVSISNGTEMLTKITAAGCSLSCLCAAYCAVCPMALDATAAAFAHFTVAADEAMTMDEVKGPGTLRVHLLDQLHLLDPKTVNEKLRIEICDV
mmetsp:Transcript_20992/g.32905  ORF Transcript_20992/g.32905 Transcript_20992/m.32905 type:complete len:237 (-) Transcript_20992:253-963(-)